MTSPTSDGLEDTLDEVDEGSFWHAVQAEHRSMSDEERAGYDDDTLRNDLDDRADDALTAERGW